MSHRLLIAAAATAASASIAHAQTPSASAISGWTLTLGVTAAGVPSFPGSSRLSLNISPRFSLRGPNAPDRFSSFDDGISPALLDIGGLRIGPNVAFARERRAGDDARLRGLRNVPFTVEAGVFAEFYPLDWLRLRAAVRNGVGGHGGLVGDLGADAIWRPDRRWTLALGPRASFGDDRFIGRYFSISAAESAASGLPSFRARGGFTGFGAAGSISHRFDAGWTVTGFAAYERLIGSADDAPLVRLRGSRDQFTVGTSLTYSFGL